EGHKEADPLDAGDVLGQALDLLVVEQVHIFLAHLGEIVFPLDLHGLGLHPVAVLPVAAVGRNLPQVDLGVEVGGEGVTMIAAVAVQDVDGVDLVKVVLQGVGGKDAGDARVKAGAQDGGQAGVLELLGVSPLPAVIKVGGEALLLAALFIDSAPGGVVGVLRLIVGGVDVVDAAGQAGVHDGQVLVRQGHIQDQVGLVSLDDPLQVLHIVGVDGHGGDLHRGAGGFQLGLQGVALGDGAAGDAQLGESLEILAALLDSDRGDAAAANDKQFAHDTFSFWFKQILTVARFSVFFFLEKVLHIARQHKGAAVQMGGVQPGLDSSLVPALGVKVLDGVVFFAGKAEQPVPRRAGGDVRLVYPADGERAVRSFVHGAAGLLVFVKEGAAV